MYQRKQSSTSYPIVFLMIDSTNHLNGKTGLTPTVNLSKNGGAFSPASGAVSEIGNGWYSLAGNSTDRNTVGELSIYATANGADSFYGKYVIVPWDPFDAVRLGMTALPNANAEASGGLPTIGTGSGQINLTSGRADSDVKAINSSLTSASNLQKSTSLILPGTIDVSAFSPTTTEFESDDITEATADHFKGRSIIFLSGALQYQATRITAYSLASGKGHFTVQEMTEAPSDNNTFIIV